MTTPGALYRYDLGDCVRCAGHIGALPWLEFIGRAGVTTDIVGEKLSEDFVGSALDRVGGTACLAARATATPFYELLVDANTGDDLSSHAALVEQRLCANPQYAYARELGQLGPVAPRAVERLLDRYTQVQARRGCRLADIKPPILISDPPPTPRSSEPTRHEDRPALAQGTALSHRGGIFKKSLRYQPLTLTTLAALAPPS
jgi:hypothetical protein